MKRRILMLLPLLLLLFLGAAYFLGPKMKVESTTRDFHALDIPIDQVEAYVDKIESNPNIKPHNEAKVMWGQKENQRTPYVLLYLHGFSASRFEGEPVISDFVHRYGVNCYMARLAGHGIEDKDAMLEMTPYKLYESAKEALAIASTLGDSVIVMGTSTGATLSLMLAADFPDKVSSLILYSPNVQIKQKTAKLLSGPWGLQLARFSFGGDYRYTPDYGTASCAYWSCIYPVESLIFLQQLLDERMTPEEFAKVKAPLFLGLYYKNKLEQDDTIEVKAAEEMFTLVSTPTDAKRIAYFPEAASHVIACEMFSGAIEAVEKATYQFVEDELGIRPIEQ